MWKEKLLSQGGKEILLKVIALAIPMHAMSCFKLLITLCSKLENLMSNFWWGQKDNEQKIHWIKWNRMCNPKSYGGLGFKKLNIFNMALIAKKGWRIHQQEQSLLHKLYKAH